MKTIDFFAQSERRQTCLTNMHTWVFNGHTRVCNVPTEAQCLQCKAHDYQPLGLSAMFPGGFQGIKRAQGGK